MARLPRLNLPDIPQHVVQTGHNNLPCFFDDEDYEFYLQSMKTAAEQYRVDIHAYVLLPNMVQFLATPRIEQGLSSMMQSLGRRYVQYVNHRYKRSGTLWGGRYKASLIDSESYLLTCYRYVELKPMYLGLANEPGEYPWSSFNFHASLDKSDLIKDHRLYIALGKTARERVQAYRKLFHYAFDSRLLTYIAETVKLGQVLGGDAFKERIEKIANQRVRPLKRGRPKKTKSAAKTHQPATLKPSAPGTQEKTTDDEVTTDSAALI